MKKDKRNLRKRAVEAMQQRQANKVVGGIVIVLALILGLGLLAYYLLSV